MAITQFPLVIWQIDDDTLMGQIVGTGYSVIDKTPGDVKRAATDYLNKIIKDDGYLYPPEIEFPIMKSYAVEVQLTYREASRIYPLPNTTRFTIPAIHEDNSRKNSGQCFLPLFHMDFYYYDGNQLKSLIEHFIRDFFEREAPERALQYKMRSIPTMDIIKVSMKNQLNYSFNDKVEIPEILKEVADQLPFAKRERKTVSRLPEVAWEQGEITDQLAKKLLNTKDNILLVGEQGVGKSTVWLDAIKAAARETKNSDAPLTFWRTTAQRLTSKAKYLGEWQEICDEVVDALAVVNGILWITDIVNLIHTGGEAQEDSVAAYLQHYIEKGQLRMIGEMKPQEKEAARALLPGFVHCFEAMTLFEMSDKTAVKVLRHYANYARQNFNIQVNDDAQDLSYQLVNRYIKYERSPGRHVRFFSECLKSTFHKKQNIIARDDIIRLFVEYTGLPEIFLRDDVTLTDTELLEFFTARIKGQDHILGTLCRIVQTYKSGLNDPDKPIATLLFTGPTGVGKTAMTKALSEYFFSSGQKRNPLLTLDMSEFQHPGHIIRLIGSAQSPGKLVQHVRNNPFSVVLLDEIEKADPSVYDALLAVLDEGILTDRFGRMTDFRSSIIIMTSNLGANDSKGFGYLSEHSASELSINAIKKYFRPEFFNRIDFVLPFAPLNKHHIIQITRREIEQICKRDRIKESGIVLEFSDALVAFIADSGFSPIYGARPIQRAIEKHVVKVIAECLLSNQRHKHLKLDIKDERIVVESDVV